MMIFLVSLWLFWTAPGDDGNVGQASAYDLRAAQDSATVAEWTGATPLSGLQAPAPAGRAESVLVSNVPENDTLWFAIKTRDEAGNWSPISNILRRTTLDTIAPAAVVDLRGAR
jgi:hypothetical protein